jgi:hypothetical protein
MRLRLVIFLAFMLAILIFYVTREFLPPNGDEAKPWADGDTLFLLCIQLFIASTAVQGILAAEASLSSC